MALITCPECGGKISDKASACIHCGFPLELLDSISHDDKTKARDFNDTSIENAEYRIKLITVKEYKSKAVSVLKNKCGYSFAEAMLVVDNLPADIFQTNDLEIIQNIAQEFTNAGIIYYLYKGNKPYKLELKPCIEKKETEHQFCPYCGKKIDIESSFCPYCGKSIEPLKKTSKPVINEQSNKPIPVRNIIENKPSIEEIQKKAELQNVMMQRAQLLQQQQQLETQRKQMEAYQRQYEAQAKCPICGSTSLSGHKQGFGIGKAAVGAVMFGGIGLLAGGINANKTVVTCMNCGHKFKL